MAHGHAAVRSVSMSWDDAAQPARLTTVMVANIVLVLPE